MKIVHISDLHICQRYKQDNIEKTDLLLREFVEMGADHLIVSGDISDNGRWEDHRIFRGLLQKYDLYHSEKVTIVFGNHDIYGGAQLITELLKYPARCRAINFQEQVQALSEFYAELFTHTLQPIKNSHFPFVKEVGSYAIFGLNSNDQYSFLRNPVGSIGYLGKQQNHWLQRLFALYKAQEWRRIVVMHHHLQRRLPQNDMPVWIQKLEQLSLKIRNRRQVESLFRQADINLLLHGHTHFSMEYSQGGVRCLNAGATCESDAAGDYLKINTIDDSSGELLVEIRSLPFLLPQPNGAMLERLQPIFAN